MTGKYRVWSSELTPSLANEAGMKAVIVNLFSSLHNAFLAVGLTQTLDAGQITDFGSIVAVGVNPSNFGYAIYEMNDIHHSNSPIFIKINFKASTASGAKAHIPIFEITVGSGSDGFGNLLNSTAMLRSVAQSESSMSFANAFNSGTTPSYVYLDEGIFWFGVNCGGINTSASSTSKPNFATPPAGPVVFFSVSRPCDESGDVVLDRVAVIMNHQHAISSYKDSFLLTNRHASCEFLNLKTGLSFLSKSPLSRPLSDQLVTINGSIPLNRAYGYFGDGKLLQVSGVSSASAVQVANGDTLDATLEGVKTRTYIVPHNSTRGYERVFAAGDDRNISGHPALDTPVMAWGGTEV